MKMLKKESSQVLYSILLMPLFLLFKRPQEQQVFWVTKIKDCMNAASNFKGPSRNKIYY